MKTLIPNLKKFSILIVAITLNFAFNASSQNGEDPASKLKENPMLDDKKSSVISPDIKNLLHYYDKQIYFTKNEGQWPANIVFKADFPLGQAVATKKGMLVGTFDPTDISVQYNYGMKEEEAKKNHTPFNDHKVKVKGHAWMMNFLNSSPLMSIESKTRHPDVFNYFIGAPSKYKTRVSNFQEVWYKNVYDNVDVRYYPSEDGTLEYDMICKPGFSKNNIAIQMDGISNLYLKQNGSLVLKTSIGEMMLPAPVAYQKINGKKILVEAHYVITGNNVVKFSIGNYDALQTLIIDPIALRWATLINNNSTGDNHGHCIWVDPSDGAIYVVARVAGTTNLITPGAFDESANGNLETIIGKYTEPDSTGGSGSRVWQTYIGGGGDDNPYAMEQGPDGNLYITGYTSSANFPLLGGSAFSGSSIDDGTQLSDNIFVMKINRDGNSIKSSVIGGNGDDGSFDLRFTPDGSILICGNTRSTNLNTVHSGIGATNTNFGGVDVIVFKINSDLSTLSWIKNYGGSGTDQATIMLNNPDNGDLYVAGYTSSSSVFPIVNARQSSKTGSTDGFIQKLKSNGTIVWSSYFNSASGKTTDILCMEFNTLRNKLYFGGITGGLNTSNVSGSVVYDNTYNSGTNDFFVASMDTNQTFNASTYIGGSGNEVNMMGLNIDLNNDVYVFGYANSTNFPTTSAALQTQLNNVSNNGVNPANDKVFLKLSSSLSSLLFSTYYGGAADDYDPVGERGIKFSNCRIYTIVTGRSNNLPLTEGAATTSKLSSTSIYEPGLVVWANPPDLSNNTIFGSQSVCAGAIPAGFTGSEPSYILPNVIRNGTISAYPVTLSSATTYQWQRSSDSINWENVTGGTNQNLSNSLIGSVYQKTYFRRIIGGDACIIAGAADQSVVIKTLTTPGTITNVTCYGFGNGSLTAHPDGTPNYSYSWNTGATSQTISNLVPGSYTVTVTDGNNCSASNTFQITQPDTLGISGVMGNITTTGGNNGYINLTVIGDTSPYNYLWNDGITSEDRSNLIAGIYTVAVTDLQGCQAAQSFTITQPECIISMSATCTKPACLGDANGSIHITVVGAQGTVTYLWNDGTTTQNRSGLTAGIYTVTATDGSGCSATFIRPISQPGPININETHINVSTLGGHNGSIDITATGGSGLKTYLWNDGVSKRDRVHLYAGTYTVTVTDKHGCTASRAIAITQPSGKAALSLEQSIKLYPNPASSEFIVQLNLDDATDAPFKIHIINTVGQVVAIRTGNFADGILREIFETNAGIADGMYQVQIIWNDQIIICALIINKE
ncbi:MAG TPA: T9SS type A sorting domain-containing protein [Chitinophagales bacterium]|nr:T9SS type A sorting domain-containing protein [Chitinophagales bacterium]